MNPPSDYGYDLNLVDVHRARLAELQHASAKQPGGFALTRTWRRLFWLSLLLTVGGLVVSGWF